MPEEVILYSTEAGSFCFRVELALHLKGVKYECIEEKLGEWSPELQNYNPIHKKVPVLVHNEKPIAESLIIIEYIDETWKGNPIMPQDPYERAMARFWAKFIDEKIMPALRTAFFSMGDHEMQEKGIQELTKLLKTLENQLEGKKFFGGDSVGLVDMAASFIAFWLGALEEAAGFELVSEEKFPKLTKWANEYGNCDAVKETLPSRDSVVSIFRGQLGKA